MLEGVNQRCDDGIGMFGTASGGALTSRVKVLERGEAVCHLESRKENKRQRWVFSEVRKRMRCLGGVSLSLRGSQRRLQQLDPHRLAAPASKVGRATNIVLSRFSDWISAYLSQHHMRSPDTDRILLLRTASRVR